MRYNSSIFIRKVVQVFMTEKGAKRKHTSKEYEAMLNEVFSMLSDKIMEGYIIRPTYEMGEFCMGVVHNYTTSKNPKVIAGVCKQRYYSDMYFVNFIAGKHKSMMYYTFRMSEEMRKR